MSNSFNIMQKKTQTNQKNPYEPNTRVKIETPELRNPLYLLALE